MAIMKVIATMAMAPRSPLYKKMSLLHLIPYFTLLAMVLTRLSFQTTPITLYSAGQLNKVLTATPISFGRKNDVPIPATCTTCTT